MWWDDRLAAAPRAAEQPANDDERRFSDPEVAAAWRAAGERDHGCPDDPALAAIWRDERDGRVWHPDPAIAAALTATSHMPDDGPVEPEPAPPVIRPEPVGGGDPHGHLRALRDAVERNAWVVTGAYRYADSARVREAGGA